MQKLINRYILLFMMNYGGTVMAQSAQPIPSAYPSSPVINYVRTWDAIKPTTDVNAMLNYGVQDVRMSTQYLDGLGRPMQAVIKQGSMATGSAATDLVSANVYDAFGREVVKYLPYGESSSSNGLFKQNPFNAQVGFYNTQLAGQTGETTVNNTTPNWGYGQTNFEASPLSRPQETFAPGVSWAGSAGQSTEANRKSVKIKYWINTANDLVRIWNVTNGSVGSFGAYATSSTYPAGQLYKTIMVDEQNHQEIEFKDKEGKVILKKVQMGNTADNGSGAGHTADWLCTYYVYDDLGNVRCVIQPEGVKTLNSNGWSFNSSILEEQCFRYEYDHRNRMIIKKVPGSGEVYMVYDNRDRLVATSDANGRSGTYTGYCYWLFTLYDAINRPVARGEMHTCMNFTSMQSYVSGLNNGNVTFNTQPGTATSLTAWNPVVGNSICTACSNWSIGTITHYDNYSGLPSGLSSYLTTWNSHFSTATTSWPYPQTPAASAATEGMVTWTSTRILGSTNYLHSANYYDDKGRIIQVQSTNATGGADVVSTQYTWAGLPYIVVQKQQNANGSGQTAEIATKNTYDDLSRLVKIEKNLRHSLVNSNNWTNYKTIAELEYDKLGQLKKKKLAPGYNSNAGLESLVYDYNIRGWLLGMNRDYAKDNNNTNYFGFDLGYDKINNGLINNQTYTTAQYNGNISGTVWKSKGDGEKRKYDFAYDNANRLLKADFNQYTGSSFNQTAGVNFNVKMGDGTGHSTAYDANGNIKQMQQWGLLLSYSSQIDNLSYSYLNGGNKLKKVTDAITANNKVGDFKDGTNSLDDYSYDGNGNLTSDFNKEIQEICGVTCEPGISYNYLNLPQQVIVNDHANSAEKGRIEYVYDASGNKLKKIVTENGQPAQTTLYIAGGVYQNDVLQFIGQEEGRIRFKPAAGSTAASLQYDYFIKDHLGNVRMMLTEEQQQDAYPYVTFEDGNIANEDIYYDNVNVSRTARPGAFYSSGTNADKVQVLWNNGDRMGAGKLLKVMSGDKLNLRVDYYTPDEEPINYPADGLTTILSGILNTINGSNPGLPIHGQGLPIMYSLETNTTFTDFLLPKVDGSPSPTTKAFLCVLFFDEQFNFVPQNSELVQTTVKGSGHTIYSTGKEAIKNGYAYAFVLNESDNFVYFDNFKIDHIRSALLEESHYYPFGLTMAGISSKAAGVTVNKENTFQDQRFDDELGLNWVQFKWRSHDPQIGRFIQIDPLSDDYRHNSTYAFSENRVTDGRELEGLEYVSIHHYPDGTNGIKMHYKSTDKEINKIHGTTAGIYNSASYGPLGKGVVHYYYNSGGEVYETRWDQQQTGGSSDFRFHGLYSGPGSITKDGGDHSTNYDFSFQPIDWSDAIAKRHDMDYAAATATGEAYAGFLEDVRTVQADKDMVQRIKDYSNLFKDVTGVETPYRTSYSGEMDASMVGQSIVISALATYKQWKIDNGYGNKDTYDKLRSQFVKDNPGTTDIIDLITQ